MLFYCTKKEITDITSGLCSYSSSLLIISFQSNPKFPSVEKVRDEIIQMVKGMTCATICPALSIYLAQSK